MHWLKVLRCGALASLLVFSLNATVERALAQSAPAPTPNSAAPVAPAPVPAMPVPVAPPPAVTDAPAAGTVTPPAPGTDAATPAERSPPDTSISQVVQIQPRPVIQSSGQSSWDEGFKTLNDAFTKLNDALAKAKLHAAGNPLAVFTETDDNGFKFTAMVPIDKAPESKPADMAADLGFGMSPGGKVMKFQHRSAYDDIDATYEAITAYLDEKGLDSQNVFAEEYINRTKTSDDPSLEVDIYVFLK